MIGGPPRLRPETIAAHPRMAEARKVYLDRFLEVYGGDPFLVRLLIESGRFFVFHYTTILDAAHDPARRETWPTIGLLKRTMARTGYASGRHIDHLVGRLCAVGYLEMRPAEQDRRVRLLRATERLWAHDRDWLVAHYAPLDFLYPQHDYRRVMQCSPDFQVLLRGLSTRTYSLGAQIMPAMADLNVVFFDRAGGFMVIAAVMQAAMESEDYPHASVPYADIGERFGVSRTHVRKVLVAAEEAGFVKLHARGGQRVEILPHLWSRYDYALALGMFLHDILYVAATRVQSAT